MNAPFNQETAIEIELPEKGIYAILNIKNDKFYIGSSKNFRKRWIQHKVDLKRNFHVNKHLQNAWNKYGQTNFMFVIIEYTTELEIREQHYLDTLKPEYNLAPTASNMTGYKHTDEAKIKMSISKRQMSDETKNKMRNSQLGKKHTQEHIQNVRNSKIGHFISAETKRKIGEANSISLIGKKHSEETKKKMSESRKKFLAWKPIIIMVPPC